MPYLLLVEDNDDFREWLTMAVHLTCSGYTVFSAPNGFKALKMLETVRPDAILLDLHMPRMDGFEFRRRQLADPRFASIPVIVMSARHDLIDLAEEMDVPILRKPVVLDEVLQAVRRLIGQN
jgi:CheY-like chemotaxis protein